MIVIKKQVDLSFLGKDYEGAYLLFKSIPIDDYKNIQDKAGLDGSEALEFIKQTLGGYFIAGKFPDENGKMQDINKEDLGQFDGETIIRCFEILTGQFKSGDGTTIDPLSETK